MSMTREEDRGGKGQKEMRREKEKKARDTQKTRVDAATFGDSEAEGHTEHTEAIDLQGY